MAKKKATKKTARRKAPKRTTSTKPAVAVDALYARLDVATDPFERKQIFADLHRLTVKPGSSAA